MTKRKAGEHAHINWDEQPLGKMSDLDLANRLGVVRTVVRAARVRRGVQSCFPSPKRQTIDWDTVPLGQVPDREIVKTYQVSTTTVKKERDKRGIPPKRRGKGRRTVKACQPKPTKKTTLSMSREDVVQIAIRWLRGETTIPDEADRLGVRSKTLYDKIHGEGRYNVHDEAQERIIGERRPAPTKAANVRCLKCSEFFWSFDKTLRRICGTCTHSNQQMIDKRNIACADIYGGIYVY